MAIVQADSFNRSKIRTVIGVVLSTDLALGDMPGNVVIEAGTAGIPKASVANVTKIVTLDRSFLVEPMGKLSAKILRRIDEGLLLVLSLGEA